MKFQPKKYARTQRTRRRLLVERLAARQLLAGDLSSHSSQFDLNQDGQVTAHDVQAIIAVLEAHDGSAIESTLADVNGDSEVNARDALVVINSIEQAAEQAAEQASQASANGGDRPVIVIPNSSTSGADWLFDLDADPDVEADRSFGLTSDFQPNSVFLAKDWNDDGQDDMIVVRKDYTAGKWQWFVDTNNDPAAEIIFHFGLIEDPTTGRPADIPVAGDWDNSNGANAGVARPNNGFLDWYLTTDDNETAEIGPVTFGTHTDMPVTGDWTGDGRDKIGVARLGNSSMEWYLDIIANGTYDGLSEGPFHFGFNTVTDHPIVGDWDNNGVDDLGIARENPSTSTLQWYRNTDRTDPLDFLPVFDYGLTSHSVILAGRWTDKTEIHVSEYLGPEVWSGRLVGLANTGPVPNTKTLIVQNTGNQELTLSPGPTPNGFEILDFPTEPLAPGEARAFTVSIDQDVAGFQRGDFVINTNDENESLFVIPLRELNPEVNVSDVRDGGEFRFSDSLVGDDVAHTFTVENLSSPNLEISDPVITGPFTLTPGSFPRTVRGGRSTTFEITVDTSVADDLEGTFSFRTNDPNEMTYNFDLLANVEVPKPEIKASKPNGGTLFFGEVPLEGSTAIRTRNLRIENVGNAPLVLSSLQINNSHFRVNNTVFPQTIERGDLIEIPVSIDRSTPGPKSSLLSIQSNDSMQSTYQINLTGNVVEIIDEEPIPQVDVSPHGGDYFFGEAEVSSLARKPFEVTNTGDAPLTITSASAAGDFQLRLAGNPSFPFTLQKNESQRIWVDMDTRSLGDTSGQFSIHSNGLPNTYRINLIGNVTNTPVTIVGEHLFSLSDARTLRNSLSSMNRPNATVSVDDSDIVRLTEYSDGEYEFAVQLSGGSIGLTTNGEDINAFDYYGGQYYLSTVGNASVNGSGSNQLYFGGDEIVRYNPSSDTWHEVYTGSSVPSRNGIDALSVLGGNRFAVSLSDNGMIPTAQVNIPALDGDLLTLYSETGNFAVQQPSGSITANRADVDAISISRGVTSVSTKGVGNFVGGHGALGWQVSQMSSSGNWSSQFDASRFGISGVEIDGYDEIPRTFTRTGRSDRTSGDVLTGDYSDAPAPYPETVHVEQLGAPVLGDSVDVETAAQPEPNAEGDDRNIFFVGVPFPDGDEDGVVVPELIPGQPATIEIEVSSADGIVDAWIDFNADGDWDDAGEKVLSSQPALIGVSNHVINVPSEIALRDTFARFRLSATGAETPNETAVGGEVEDYLVSVAGAEFFVTNTNDAGTGSLRQAILDANQSTTAAEVVFAIPESDGGFVDADVASGLAGADAAPDVFRIELATNLPVVDNVHGKSIRINALTQSLLTGDSNPNGPEIVLDGQNVTGGHGLILQGDDISVRGLNIQRFNVLGILGSGSNLTVAGNYVGTDPTGRISMPNNFHGIQFIGANDSTIGGPTTADRNVVSGNSGNGIEIGGSSNQIVVQNNYVGIDVTGESSLSNAWAGINVWGSTAIALGKDGVGNVVSGNGQNGIAMNDSVANVVIENNFIGTNASGTQEIGNAFNGISSFGADGFVIGGDQSKGNLISGNDASGIELFPGTTDATIAGNQIGVDQSGAAALPNAFQGIGIQGTQRVSIGGPTSSHRNVIAGNGLHNISAISGTTELLIQNNFIGTNVVGDSAIGGSLFDNVRLFGTRDAIVSENVISGSDQNGLRIEQSGTPTVLFHWPVSEGGNGHYYLQSPADQWQQLRTDATALGGYLATINNQAENSFLAANMQIGSAWIGLNDAENEGTFVWANGESYDGETFTGFVAPEPNGGAGENYVALNSNGTWNDLLLAQIPALIEFESMPTLETIDLFYQDDMIEVSDNVIGLDALADAKLPNQGDGVLIVRSGNTVISSNTISGNRRDGIDVQVSSRSITISENTIGTNVANDLAIGNGDVGISIQSSFDNTLSSNRIAGNGGAGIRLIETGTERTTNNLISQNLIHDNLGLGIDLNGDGVTLNDELDVDGDANLSQNFPQLQSVELSGGTTGVTGTLSSKANEVFTVELFESDAGGYQSNKFLGATQIITDSTGRAAFSVVVPVSVPVGKFVIATATDASNNTSEFSRPISAPSSPPSIQSVQINDGTDSRSQITSVTVTFDQRIDHSMVVDAFSLTNLTTDTAVDDLIIETSVGADQRSIATITFATGPSVDTRTGAGGLSHSLSDGNYALTVDSSHVVAIGGPKMSQDFQYGDVEADAFFRMLGDSDGDRDVDGQDYGRFGLSFLKSIGQVGYDQQFDSDGDGDVDGQDYGRFGQRFLQQLPF